MLDRIRDAVSIDSEDSNDESPTKVSELDTDQVIADFEEFVRMEGVDVEDEESALLSEFKEAVEIFEEIQPNLAHVEENVSNGEYVSFLDQVNNEEFDQWIANDDHVIDTLGELKETNERVYDKIVNVDESIDDEDFPDELDRYMTRLFNYYVVFEV